MNKRNMKSSSLLKVPFKPVLTIIITAVVSELLIMAALESLSIHNVYLSGYLDTILLLVLLSTFLYFLVIRPMDYYIKESNKAKEALFEREEHYRALANSGQALIWKTGVDGQCSYVNETLLNFTGRSLEQELGYGWKEIIHPEDLKHIEPVFQLAFSEHENFSVKHRMRHASGEYRWIQSNGTATFNKKGEFTGYVGHSLDIHQYQQAQEVISRREKDYRTVFEHIPNAVIFWDTNGTILFWNKEAEKILGWSKEETIGKNMTCFFKPDYNHPEINYTLDDLLTRYNQATTREYRRNDGTTIICEWRMTPIYGLDGKMVKIITVAKDITEQLHHEQQLIAAKEKAEESERLKSAFLANMTHELRSPLNSIIGFSELLADPGFDPDHKEQFAQLINIGGKNLLATINELMDYSKIDAGQVKVNKQPVSLNALLQELQLEYSFKAAEKGIDLRLDAQNPTDDLVIHTDQVKLRQVLVNFIANALKFTNQGFIELGLRTTDSLVQLHVRDTGIGIPQSYQEKIFQRFLQLEAPNRQKYGGIGLGLAISKSLVELMGGTIWVESQEGAGSCFYFTLPLQQDQEIPSTKNPPEQRKKTQLHN